MNIYVVIQGFNLFSSLAVFLFLASRRFKNAVHQTYALWSLILFLWTFFYLLWGIQKNEAQALYWFQMLMYPICFIHVAFFHFVITYTQTIKRYRIHLILGYIYGVILSIINMWQGFYKVSYVRPRLPFLFWPHGTPLTGLIMAGEVCFLTLSFWILFSSMKQNSGESRIRLKGFLIASLIGWLGGITNWFYWFDSVPVPPFGNICVSFLLVAMTYLIFKHDFLGLNLAIQRTFVYATLTLFTTLTYALFIILSERLFQRFVGYSSIIGTLMAGLTIALLFNPVRSASVKLLNRRFFGKDIEELSLENLQMKIELQKTDRMKAVATLAAGMAHEIKNPLTVIKTFAEYLPAKYNDPEFREKFQRIVADEVDRVNNIVGQLLDFSKPEALQVQNQSLIPIIDETLALLNNNFVKNKIEVVKQYEADPSLRLDRNQMKQVFLNIFLNSIQAMSSGGTLTISVCNGKSGVVVSIQDTGFGIPLENLPHIFDPFFTTKESGTGLGLSIVHGIIAKHGGKIQVKSVPGRGTRFEIYFNSRETG